MFFKAIYKIRIENMSTWIKFLATKHGFKKKTCLNFLKYVITQIPTVSTAIFMEV